MWYRFSLTANMKIRTDASLAERELSSARDTPAHGHSTQHTAHTTYYIAPSATHIPGLGHSSRYRLVLATCRADSWNDVVLDGTNQSVRGHGQPSQGVSHRGNGAASLTEDPEGRRKHCGGHQQPPKRGRQLQGRHKAFPLCTMQYHAVS